jgi:hypothetical protein
MSSLRIDLKNIDMLFKQSTQPVWYIYYIAGMRASKCTMNSSNSRWHINKQGNWGIGELGQIGSIWTLKYFKSNLLKWFSEDSKDSFMHDDLNMNCNTDFMRVNKFLARSLHNFPPLYHHWTCMQEDRSFNPSVMCWSFWEPIFQPHTGFQETKIWLNASREVSEINAYTSRELCLESAKYTLTCRQTRTSHTSSWKSTVNFTTNL